ncbi:protein DOWNY MILDEW RESISTANCE 6 isoform X1 [Cannabis sativa]|uniref:protein DOWNY MILDEW RESISTANCE 6 isoform X1 n=1 Tax=Cannabis sativa TaxID=3483 RepID=UPI0029C9E158|nr:protein DOWNY MILDEW RESISTANCE 6 isoform X1 [Cannabis sativa]
MEKLLSTKTDLNFVPDSYILPPHSRPGKTKLSTNSFHTIPIIDLKQQQQQQQQLIHHIIQASKEFGFFQLINHGIEEKLIQDVLDVTKEFFELPIEDKQVLYSDDPTQICRLYTSIGYGDEIVHYWRDVLRHLGHPIQKHIQFWPQKPPQYREVMGRYAAEVRKLSLYVLDLICKGLGIEDGCMGDESEVSKVHVMSVSHYPPCPDPTLTLGLPKHADVNLITLLLQQVDGLQVIKDGQWLPVHPLPNAIVVNIGYTLQIMSNGRLSSGEHRVVTNQKVGRTSVGSFILPSMNCQIKPIINDDNDNNNKLLFKPIIFKDLLANYVADTKDTKPPLDRYKITSTNNNNIT